MFVHISYNLSLFTQIFDNFQQGKIWFEEKNVFQEKRKQFLKLAGVEQ